MNGSDWELGTVWVGLLVYEHIGYSTDCEDASMGGHEWVGVMIPRTMLCGHEMLEAQMCLYCTAP